MMQISIYEIRQKLREEVLEETDDPEIKYHVRTALQHLVLLEDRLQHTPTGATVS